jgi:predicted outer membrane repeat protein
MENSSNEKTMNFTANTWATSGSGIRMTLISISGDWYEVTSGGSYPSFEKLNLKLVNGKLEVREEDPYWSTGTWAKQ